jgi:hypothetical protein
VLGASVNYSPEFAASEPNINLLNRIVDAGGGRMLDLRNPSLNPFEINRQKTFQPRDLWEWLLRFAILLFPVDVGIRRIQIDRAEWLKALQRLRGMLLFWRAKPRAPQAEESLNALLARKEQVRAKTTKPAAEPNPNLFKPAAAPKLEASASPQPAAPDSKPEAAKEKGKSEAAQTTSRLLEAKRRAQRK